MQPQKSSELKAKVAENKRHFSNDSIMAINAKWKRTSETFKKSLEDKKVIKELKKEVLNNLSAKFGSKRVGNKQFSYDSKKESYGH